MADPAHERVRRAYETRPRFHDDVGSGPPVVFAHGTLMDRTMFDPQVEALSGDYRCVAYDLRARTEYYAPEYDLYDLVGDLEALLDALDVDSCTLVGMSMGGFTGLRFALEHGDRLDGLVLVDSMAGVHSETQIQTYDAMVSQIEGTDDIPEGLAETSAQILFGDTTHEERPNLVQEWVERWRSYVPDAVANEVRSWLRREDLVDRMDEIEVPVLAVHGDEDTSITVDDARETVDAVPDGRLEVVEGAGHSSNDEQPEQVNRQLESFLGELY